MKAGTAILILAAGGIAALAIWIAMGKPSVGSILSTGEGYAASTMGDPHGPPTPIPYVPPTALPDRQAFDYPRYAGASPTTLQPRYSVTRTAFNTRFA